MVCVCVCSVMSDSLWPHGQQPTRLRSPWDFPGKNTEAGCFSRGSSWPRIEPKSPVSIALAGRFFTTSSLIGLFGHNWQINTDTLLLSIWASLVPQMVKNLPVVWETWVCSLGQEDSLKEMTTQFSILAWWIPRRLVGHSPWDHRELDSTEWLTHSLFHFHGNSIFSVLRYLHIAFLCTNLDSHQKFMIVPFSPHPHQDLNVLSFW